MLPSSFKSNFLKNLNNYEYSKIKDLLAQAFKKLGYWLRVDGAEDWREIGDSVGFRLRNKEILGSLAFLIVNAKE